MINFLLKPLMRRKKHRQEKEKAIDDFINLVKNKIKIGGWIQFNGDGSDDITQWNLSREEDKDITFTGENEEEISLKKLRKFMVNFINKHKIAIIMLSNSTGEKINQNYVHELWGFRLLILEEKIILFPISLDELYLSYTYDFENGKQISPHEATIYCGPEGEIKGWEKINTPA